MIELVLLAVWLYAVLCALFADNVVRQVRDTQYGARADMASRAGLFVLSLIVLPFFVVLWVIHTLSLWSQGK